WKGATAHSRSGTGFHGQPHLVQIRNQALQQFRVTTGEYDLHSVATDLGGQNIPMQLRDRGPIGKEGKRVAGDRGQRWRYFYFVISLQMIPRVVDQFERVARRQWREEHILRRDQDRPSICSLVCFRGT